MPVVLKNATLNTSRNPYSASTGTQVAQPYLQGIEAHVGPVSAQDYIKLPAAALEANLKIKVDVGTDIRIGDQITGIFQLDSKTPWEGHSPNDAYQIKFIEESDPGPLQHRKIFLKHLVMGGPSYSGV